MTSPESTSVTVVLNDSDETNSRIYHGTVHDLSSKGMRLNLPIQLALEQKVQIRLCVPEYGIDMLTSGIIRWGQTRDETTWWVGCLLDEPLSKEFLLELATHRIIDRRQDERTKTSIPAKIKLELNSDPIDVTISNYSFGGICITSPKPYEFSRDRLLLVLSPLDDAEIPNVQIPVRVRWKGDQPDGFSVGCAFVSHEGYVALRDFISNNHGAISRKRCYEVSPMQFNGTWIAIALMVLISLKVIDLSTTDAHPFDSFLTGWKQIHQSSNGLGEDDSSESSTIPVKNQENVQILSH